MKDCRKYYRDDDFRKQDYDCKEKCDCCCTPGIREALERLLGRNIAISTTSGPATIFSGVGTLVSVDCDVARLILTLADFSIITSVSVCEITMVSEITDEGGGPASVSKIVELLNGAKK